MAHLQRSKSIELLVKDNNSQCSIFNCFN